MSTPTPAQTTPWLAGFESLERELAADGPPWLRRLRQQGLELFQSRGLPTPQQEEWRNTNLAPLAALRFRPPAAGRRLALPAAADVALGPTRLVFVDGRFDADRSTVGELPGGVYAGSLAALLARDPERARAWLQVGDDLRCPEFSALNSAFLQDGAAVLVPDGVSVEQPLQIVYLAAGAPEPPASHPRTVLALGAGARASVVEWFVGAAPGAYFTNAFSDARVGDGAALDHYRLQLENEQAFHLSTVHSRQGRDSRYRSWVIQLGGRLVRQNLVAVLDGEGGDARLFGLYLPRHAQHVDNHTVLDHARPHCDSRELYKGVLDDESRAVFSGRIIVRPDAQKTDAKQSNPNLLLSAKALAHTRPQLEIYADDVKCTHGATIGRVDEDAIYYLRSRGIPKHEALNLLTNAFAGEVLQQIEIEPLREQLSGEIAGRLRRIREGSGS